MNVQPMAGDEQLLQRIRAGDEEAFRALYRGRQGAIYRFALQMSGSPTLAEEVVQEVFLTLIGETAHFDPARGSLAAYLYGIARHHLLRCLRRESPMVPLEEQPGGHDVAGELARRERIEWVRRAVLSLPVDYREAVVLCDLEEMGYAEAAEALGCPVGTVRSRLHRARALLVEKLGAVLGPARCLV